MAWWWCVQFGSKGGVAHWCRGQRQCESYSYSAKRGKTHRAAKVEEARILVFRCSGGFAVSLMFYEVILKLCDKVPSPALVYPGAVTCATRVCQVEIATLM